MKEIIAGMLGLTSWLPFQSIKWLRRRLSFSKKSIWIHISPENRSKWTEGSLHWQGLDAIASNQDIRTVVLSLQAVPVGWANIQAFRQSLLRIKESGKAIFAYVQTPMMHALYLSSVADSTWLLDGVDIFWGGVGGRHSFYGGLFEKLGIKADILAAGEYKSFGEAYTRKEASQANQEQLMELYQDLQDQYLSDMAQGFGVEEVVLRNLMAQSPICAQSLQEAGLIDGVFYPDQLKDKVKSFTNTSSGSWNFSSYLRWFKWQRFWQWGDPRPKIAVLHLEGSIVEGNSKHQGIVAESTIETLEYLRMDENIVAVVMAVNSPGGSAIASDRIARSVELLKAKKPVIAYFGNVSASGGYYLSAMADEIIAQPATITGSIGVVGGKLVIGEALEKLGVHGQVIAAGVDSDMLDFWTPFNDDQRVRFQHFLTRTYDRFIKVVSKGRKMPEEAVESSARGRVWTGRKALELGLVDQVGSLKDAVARAALRADCNPKYIAQVHFRFEKSWWQKSPLSFLRGQVTLEDLLIEQAPIMVQFVKSHSMQPLMLLPFEFEYQAEKCSKT